MDDSNAPPTSAGSPTNPRAQPPAVRDVDQAHSFIDQTELVFTVPARRDSVPLTMRRPLITVVDVGDGACTVLRCPMHFMGCSCGVVVVDCGVYKGRPATSMEKLVGTLGDEGLDRLDTMVVTHFDRDHWEGLRLLASHLRDRPHKSEMKLVYPRVPERELHPGVLYMALLATWTGSGVRALDRCQPRVRESPGRAHDGRRRTALRD